MRPVLRGNVVLDHVEGDGLNFEVITPFEYEDSEYVIKIKPGWNTNGVSVPRFLWWAFPPLGGEYLEAAVLHDALYASQILPRPKADLIFYKTMRYLGVKKSYAKAFYYAVRLFGNIAWKRNKKNVDKFQKYVEVVFKRNVQNEVKEIL